jgi:hypothetical protein
MEQFTQEMLKRLDALASKLGMAATALWGFYIRQARITGAIELVCFFLCISGVFLCNRWRALCWSKTEKGDGYIWGALWSGLGMFGLSALAIGFLYWGATAIFNPGYWAFQTIVDQLKGQ